MKHLSIQSLDGEAGAILLDCDFGNAWIELGESTAGNRSERYCGLVPPTGFINLPEFVYWHWIRRL